jgi:biotin carboxylase
VPLSRPRDAAERIVALAGRKPLDAVVAVDDQGVLVAALAARALGLRHNRPEAVAATRDKALMRRRLAGAGVPQPAFRVAGPQDDVARLAAETGLPCVVKPVSLSGSRGVIRADEPALAARAAQRVRRILADAGEDPHGPILVERFLPGREVAVEGLVRAGVLELLAVFDKPDPLDGPYFEETLYVTPARLAPPILDRVAARTAESVRALGLDEGPVHAELRVAGDSVGVLEVAARSIGGLCARSLRFGLGLSLEEVILRHALGRPLQDARREPGASGVMMLPIPAAGVLEGVWGEEDARAVPGISGLEISVNVGRPVRPLPDGDRYLGFLFARGQGPDEVENSLRRAHARLRVRIRPPEPAAGRAAEASTDGPPGGVCEPRRARD